MEFLFDRLRPVEFRPRLLNVRIENDSAKRSTPGERASLPIAIATNSGTASRNALK